MIRVREPLFRAGYRFGWLDDFMPMGISLNNGFLNGEHKNLTVYVSDKKRVYQISKVRAKELINRYNSRYEVKMRNTQFSVVSSNHRQQTFESVAIPLDAFKELVDLSGLEYEDAKADFITGNYDS